MGQWCRPVFRNVEIGHGYPRRGSLLAVSAQSCDRDATRESWPMTDRCVMQADVVNGVPLLHQWDIQDLVSVSCSLPRSVRFDVERTQYTFGHVASNNTLRYDTNVVGICRHQGRLTQLAGRSSYHRPRSTLF